jgi:radical SAM superfamily enzyme YgiQ (UPF0313 family)
MYPTGILCLSGYLEKTGYRTTVIDSAIFPGTLPAQGLREQAVIERVKALRPAVVCFSSTHREFAEACRLNKAVREALPGVFTIVGGSQPTYRASDFLENGFDFVCRGEGEKTLKEFCDMALSGRGEWNAIPGLCWNREGRPVFNPARELLTEAELDAAGVLPYEKIDPRYFGLNLMTIRGMPLRGALLLTTRGCPYNCSYCGCNLIFGRKLRFRSLKTLEAEVAYLKERFGVEGLWIVDDTFTVKRGHCEGVAAILKGHGMVWGCQSRVDTVDASLLEVMRESGCLQIDFGVESGSQRILDDIIGKRTKIPQVHEAFRACRRLGIRTLANFMVGLPTETYEDLALTHKVARQIAADAYIFSIATPLPGTRLYEMVNEHIGPQDYALLDWNGSCLTRKLNKSAISDLVREKERLYKKFLFRMLLRSFVSGANYRFFLTHDSKCSRLAFVAKSLARYAGRLAA